MKYKGTELYSSPILDARIRMILFKLTKNEKYLRFPRTPVKEAIRIIRKYKGRLDILPEHEKQLIEEFLNNPDRFLSYSRAKIIYKTPYTIH